MSRTYTNIWIKKSTYTNTLKKMGEKKTTASKWTSDLIIFTTFNLLCDISNKKS